MKTDSKLLRSLRTELAKAADSKKAPQMQAYMKSQMPYHGVPSPIFKKICNSFFNDISLPDATTWQTHILDIWRNAKFREERYAALFLAGHSRAKTYQTMEAMDVYEEMIVTGAWWDYVDDIATHRVGAILANDPKAIQRLMLVWSKSDDIWKRRTAILCQIGSKDKINFNFLSKCIEPSIGSKEFFLRKAIGWALRQVAWHDPQEVIRYVKKNSDLLSPLSKREALKNVIKAGKIKVIP